MTLGCIFGHRLNITDQDPLLYPREAPATDNVLGGWLHDHGDEPQMEVPGDGPRDCKPR